MKLTSDFALLDVKKGRKDLFKKLGYSGRQEPPARVPITITGYLVGAWGGDDGVSQEFEVEVETVSCSPISNQ